MAFNPYGKIKIPSVEDYSNAIAKVDEYSAQMGESTAAVIEGEAQSMLHQEIKIHLGFAARDMLAREDWHTAKHRKLCRALGLGGYAGYLITKNVYTSLEFFNISVQPPPTYIDPADYRLLLSERAQDMLTATGEPTKEWLEARSTEASGIDEADRYWYVVGASEALGCVRGVALIRNGE